MGRDELWRIDPTGQFWNCHAAIIGRQSDRVEEALVTKLMERMKEKEDEGDTDEVDMTLYLQSISCDEALDMVCECLHSVFWPKPINLRGLPEGVKASIPSIPWVAVTLRNTQLQQLSGKTPFRRIQRGAFLPPILRDGEEDKDGTIKGDVGSQI